MSEFKFSDNYHLFIMYSQSLIQTREDGIVQEERHLGLVKYLNHRILKNNGIYSHIYTYLFVCF